MRDRVGRSRQDLREEPGRSEQVEPDSVVADRFNALHVRNRQRVAHLVGGTRLEIGIHQPVELRHCHLDGELEPIAENEAVAQSNAPAEAVVARHRKAGDTWLQHGVAARLEPQERLVERLDQLPVGGGVGIRAVEAGDCVGHADHDRLGSGRFGSGRFLRLRRCRRLCRLGRSRGCRRRVLCRFRTGGHDQQQRQQHREDR